MKKPVRILVLAFFIVWIGILITDYYFSMIRNEEPKFATKIEQNKENKSFYNIGLLYRINNNKDDNYEETDGVVDKEFFLIGIRIKTTYREYEMKIIDESENKVCADALEKFYENEDYEFYFPCQKSHMVYITIKKEKKLVKEALENNLVSTEKLKDLGLEFYQEPKIYFETIKSKKCSIKKIINSQTISHDVYLKFNLYSYCIDEAYVYLDGERHTLEKALRQELITVEKILELMDYDSSYWEGGTTLYKSKETFNKDTNGLSILKCNTIEGNKDFYIGDKSLTMMESFCK